MAIQQLCALVAVLIGVGSTIPYLRGCVSRTIRPHAFSWLVWTGLTGIGAGVQLRAHGGPGAVVSVVTTLLCAAVCVAAFMLGDRRYSAFDWWSLAGAMLALGVWLGTDTPLLAVLLITLVDALGFAPTIRKAYLRPGEEALPLWWWSGAKNLLGVAALTPITLVTSFYPFALVVLNSLFAIMVILRRQHLSRPAELSETG